MHRAYKLTVPFALRARAGRQCGEALAFLRCRLGDLLRVLAHDFIARWGQRPGHAVVAREKRGLMSITGGDLGVGLLPYLQRCCPLLLGLVAAKIKLLFEAHAAPPSSRSARSITQPVMTAAACMAWVALAARTCTKGSTPVSLAMGWTWGVLG